jgi:hypothetical protein
MIFPMNRSDDELIKLIRDTFRRELRKVVSLHYREILNICDAAEMMYMSPGNLRRLCEQEKIKYFKPNGKLIYFRREDIFSYIFRNQVKQKEHENR